MKAIDLDSVTVSYRENVALKEVSLQVEDGDFLAVMGPNGAGKTTVLTTINGIGRIISGNVRIFGERLTRWNAGRIRQSIGYVPQSLSIDPRSPISVQDVVMMGRAGRIGLLRRPWQADVDVVQEAMRRAGLSQFARRPIGHLSGGERQKVSIARALAQEPRILLLDEPTSNLDPKAQAEIIQLVDEIYKERKLVIIFVTHILSHIPPSCNGAVLMKEGRIVWSGDINKALSEELLSNLYGGVKHFRDIAL